MNVGRTAACSAILILALGAALFALRNTPDRESVGATPVAASAGSTLEESSGLMEHDRQSSIVAPSPDAPAEDVVGAGPLLSSSDDSQWDDRDVKDTGPFIDADDDAADFSFSPVSDVGDFIDPDAG